MSGKRSINNNIYYYTYKYTTIQIRNTYKENKLWILKI